MEHRLKKLSNLIKLIELTLYNHVYSLLYVVQNFYKHSPYVKITYKIKLLWVFKNSRFISTLSKFHYLSLVHDFNIIRSTLLTPTTKTILPLLLTSFFENIEHLMFKKHLKTPKSFWKINLDSSLKYNLFKNMLETTNEPSSISLPQNNFIYNQYYWPLFVANVSLHKKLYRTFFITYLFHTISIWPKLNNHFNLILKYYLISDNFLLLGYYNKYFFKVYNF